MNIAKCSNLFFSRSIMSSPKRMKIAGVAEGGLCTSKVLKKPRNDLQNMSRDELIHAATFYKNNYGQLKNRLNESSSKLNKMTVRLNNLKMRRKRKKKIKEIDFSTENYRRVALKFLYFGWDYEGLQENPNLDDTIERIIREAIRGTKLATGKISVTRCGRTDKGVSAFCQVITVMLRTKLTSGSQICKANDLLYFEDLTKEEIINNIQSKADLKTDCITPGCDQESAIANNQDQRKNTSPIQMDCDPAVKDVSNEEEEFEYVTMLNRVLPEEIKVLAWAPVDLDFSARFKCTGREYRYYFPRGKLDIDRMNDGAKRFVGLHDFRNFGKVNVLNCMNYVRRIFEFEVKLCNEVVEPLPHDMCYAQIKGSGFIYHQVRSMMTMLFLIGMEHEEAGVITELLDVEKNKCKPAFGLAPPYPLVLYDCKYENVKWRVPSHSILSTLIQLQSSWTEFAVKAQMAKECALLCQNNDEIQIENEPKAEKLKKDQFVGRTPHELSRSYDLNSTLHGIHSKLISDCYSLDKAKYKPILTRQKGLSITQHLDHLEEKKIRIEKREAHNSDIFNKEQNSD